MDIRLLGVWLFGWGVGALSWYLVLKLHERREKRRQWRIAVALGIPVERYRSKPEDILS